MASITEADLVRRMAGQHFDQSLLAIEAARYGQGSVLCSAILVEAEMHEGAL